METVDLAGKGRRRRRESMGKKNGRQEGRNGGLIKGRGGDVRWS
jgi:hypothetical protein